MNNIKQIQAYIREKVILANHPEAKTYEEALELELGFGCDVIIRSKLSGRLYGNQIIVAYNKKEESFLFIGDEKATYKNQLHKIIGQPITLAKILNTLKTVDKAEGMGIATNGKFYNDNDGKFYGGTWNFLKNFEGQSERILLIIAKLLGYNE